MVSYLPMPGLSCSYRHSRFPNGSSPMSFEYLNSLFDDCFREHSDKPFPVNLSSALLRQLADTVASADFSDPLSSPLDDNTLRWQGRSEISRGNALTPSHLYLPHLHSCLPGKYWTSEIYPSLSGMTASYVISVRQVSALPPVRQPDGSASLPAAGRLQIFPCGMPFGTPHGGHPCPPLMIPLTRLIGDLHSQVSALCRAHNKKARRTDRALIHVVF